MTVRTKVLESFWPLLWTLLLAAAPSANSQETIIHHFAASAHNGSQVESGLVADGQGALYGVTQIGGTLSCPGSRRGCGVVYRLTPPAQGEGGWDFTILHSFTGLADGGVPYGNLFIDSQLGLLYGTTYHGGSNDDGTVYSLTLGNPGILTVLYNFQGGADGSGPAAGVTLHNGSLYGTNTGPAPQSGVFFQLTPSASGEWREQTLHNFPADSGYPFSTPVFDSAGNVYGTTSYGDLGGVVYELIPPIAGGTSWEFRSIHTFTGARDGSIPTGNLSVDSSGAFYGTTLEGGIGFGTVYKLTRPSSGTGSWTEDVLYSFTGAADGDSPLSGVVIDAQGNLYGTASGGGNYSCTSDGCGTLFELTLPSAPGGSWTKKTIYKFQGSDDGGEPTGNLTLLDGNLYGVTLVGGANNAGVVFDVLP
jgi:uncharacterized repeat protein (TIGR03803 family)